MPDLVRFARDALYVTVGTGVLTVQRLQVEREQLRRRLQAQLDEAREGWERLNGVVDDQVRDLEDRLGDLEDRAGELLDQAEERGVDAAGDEVERARRAVREPQEDLRTLANR